MARCNQPCDDDARFKCEKHQVFMCRGCLKCKDPELYCKFRPSCMIHFLEKEHESQGPTQSELCFHSGK